MQHKGTSVRGTIKAELPPTTNGDKARRQHAAPLWDANSSETNDSVRFTVDWLCLHLASFLSRLHNMAVGAIWTLTVNTELLGRQELILEYKVFRHILSMLHVLTEEPKQRKFYDGENNDQGNWQPTVTHDNYLDCTEH